MSPRCARLGRLAVVALCALASACSDELRPGVVVAVYGDLQVRQVISRLQFDQLDALGRVRGEPVVADIEERADTTYLGGIGIHRGERREFRLRVLGYDRSNEASALIERKVWAEFASGTGLLRVMLTADCLNRTSCGPTDTCDPGTSLCARMPKLTVEPFDRSYRAHLEDASVRQASAEDAAGRAVEVDDGGAPQNGRDAVAPSDVPDAGVPASEGERTETRAPDSTMDVHEVEPAEPFVDGGEPGQPGRAQDASVDASVDATRAPERHEPTSCEQLCDVAHAVQPTCENQVCAAASCDTGWANCVTSDSLICETNLMTSHAHCGSCSKRCVYDSCSLGRCADAVWGYYSGEGLVTFEPHTLIGIHATLPSQARLLALGLRPELGGVEKPVDVRMGLYSDDGRGTPKELLAQTEKFRTDALTNGDVRPRNVYGGVELPVTQELTLGPLAYWIFVIADGPLTLKAASAVVLTKVARAAQDFGALAEMPSTVELGERLRTPSNVEKAAINLYYVTRPLDL